MLLTGLARAQNKVADSSLMQLARLANDTSKVNVLNKMAFNFAVQGKNQEAWTYADEAEKLSRSLHYINGFAQSYMIRGIVSRNRGENELALRYYFITVQITLATGNKSMYAKANHNMARIYENLGDYSKAIQCLFISLKVKESIGDKRGMANTLSHLGNIYHIQKDKRALQIYLMALELEKQTNNYAGQCIVLNNIGIYYKDNLEYSKALKYFHQSLQVNERANYLPDIGRSYVNMGEIYSQINNNRIALAYCNRALEIFERLNDWEASSYVYNCLGKLYLKQNSNIRALECLNKGLRCANVSNVLKRKRDIHESLSKVYERLNNPHQSLVEYKLFIQLRDSIYNVETSTDMIRAELNFEYSKKQAIQEFELEKKEILFTSSIQKKQIQLLIVLALLILILFSAILLIQRIQHKQRLKVIGLRNKIANDLHDEVGSALSSISLFTNIAKMNPNDLSNESIIAKIGETSRVTVENMSDIVWSINTKNDSFVNLIERMRLYGYSLFENSTIQFTFSSPAHLDKLKIGMESRKQLLLLYKEALNNIVKHSKATLVDVILKLDSKMIHFEIIDNGIGFNTHLQRKGNGLNSLEERALALKGKIEIKSENAKGTRISLFITTTSLGR